MSSARAEKFEDRNADGVVDGHTLSTLGARQVPVGETNLWDTDYDGRVDHVGTWGTHVESSVADRFAGTPAKDVLFEEIRNPFKRTRGSTRRLGARAPHPCAGLAGINDCAALWQSRVVPSQPTNGVDQTHASARPRSTSIDAHHPARARTAG